MDKDGLGVRKAERRPEEFPLSAPQAGPLNGILAAAALLRRSAACTSAHCPCMHLLLRLRRHRPGRVDLYPAAGYLGGSAGGATAVADAIALLLVSWRGRRQRNTAAAGRPA